MDGTLGTNKDSPVFTTIFSFSSTTLKLMELGDHPLQPSTQVYANGIRQD